MFFILIYVDFLNVDAFYDVSMSHYIIQSKITMKQKNVCCDAIDSRSILLIISNRIQKKNPKLNLQSSQKYPRSLVLDHFSFHRMMIRYNSKSIFR